MLHAAAHQYSHLGRRPRTARHVSMCLLRLLKRDMKPSPAHLRPYFVHVGQSIESPRIQFTQVWATLPAERRLEVLEQMIQAIDARSERDRLLATLAQALVQADG